MEGHVKSLVTSALLVCTLCLGGQPAFAQTSVSPSAADTTTLGQGPNPTPSVFQDLFGSTLTDFKNLGRLESLTWLTIGALAATTTHQFDASVTSEVSGAAMARNF